MKFGCVDWKILAFKIRKMVFFNVALQIQITLTAIVEKICITDFELKFFYQLKSRSESLGMFLQEENLIFIQD